MDNQDIKKGFGHLGKQKVAGNMIIKIKSIICSIIMLIKQLLNAIVVVKKILIVLLLCHIKKAENVLTQLK